MCTSVYEHALQTGTLTRDACCIYVRTLASQAQWDACVSVLHTMAAREWSPDATLYHSIAAHAGIAIVDMRTVVATATDLIDMLARINQR